MTHKIQGYGDIPAYSKSTIQNKQANKIDRSFETFLNEAWKKTEQPSELKFSKHAQKRLEERGIQLNETDLTKIEQAVEKMDAKGAKQSLVMYEDLALITNIHNKTIITALNTTDMTEFTDIDSAILVSK